MKCMEASIVLASFCCRMGGPYHLPCIFLHEDGGRKSVPIAGFPTFSRPFSFFLADMTPFFVRRSLFGRRRRAAGGNSTTVLG